MPGGGIPLGQLDGEVIGIPYGANRGHYAIIAPTLSGKGLHATATLLRWPDAAVVVDPKAELYERTAGTRAATVGPVYRVPEQSIDLLDYYDFDDPLDVQFLHETLLRVWQDREPFWAEKSLPLFFAAQKCAKATGDASAAGARAVGAAGGTRRPWPRRGAMRPWKWASFWTPTTPRRRSTARRSRRGRPWSRATSGWSRTSTR